MISAAVSKYTGPRPASSPATEARYAVSVPTAISVSMLAARLRARRAASRRNGHPPQNWTGVASANSVQCAQGRCPSDPANIAR